MKRRPYFVFDFPPGQLANHELHQHVEEGPQVVVATHFLQDTRGGARREKGAEAERVESHLLRVRSPCSCGR